MVKHVIIWTLKDEFNEKRKAEIKKDIKSNLEGLVGKVPGLLEVKVIIDGLDSSTGDLMLDTSLDSVESLKGYATHPAHVAVADTYVRPYTAIRSCYDFEV